LGSGPLKVVPLILHVETCLFPDFRPLVPFRTTACPPPRFPINRMGFPVSLGPGFAKYPQQANDGLIHFKLDLLLQPPTVMSFDPRFYLWVTCHPSRLPCLKVAVWNRLLDRSFPTSKHDTLPLNSSSLSFSFPRCPTGCVPPPPKQVP